MNQQTKKYRIEFDSLAQASIVKAKKSNPQIYKKLLKLIPELEEHPRTGTAHPEPLIKGSDITYSRRLSAHNRLIYDIYDDHVIVLILSVEGHYNDK